MINKETIKKATVKRKANVSSGFDSLIAVFVNKKDKPTIVAFTSAHIYAK